jgi:hypothetical protein
VQQFWNTIEKRMQQNSDSLPSNVGSGNVILLRLAKWFSTLFRPKFWIKKIYIK